MTRSCSNDVRERVVPTHFDGRLTRRVAARFRRSVSSASEWAARPVRPAGSRRAGSAAAFRGSRSRIAIGRGLRPGSRTTGCKKILSFRTCPQPCTTCSVKIAADPPQGRHAGREAVASLIEGKRPNRNPVSSQAVNGTADQRLRKGAAVRSRSFAYRPVAIGSLARPGANTVSSQRQNGSMSSRSATSAQASKNMPL